MAANPNAQPAAPNGDDGRVRRLYGSILSRRPLPIRFQPGDPPPTRWQRFIRWWRYGSYHPDEDLLGVIDAAIDALTTQIKSAEGILSGSRREALDRLRGELNAELADEVPELAVLLGIEAKINALYPPAIQRQRAWMIAERFRRVAPAQAAQYWEATRGETLLAEEQDDKVRRADEAVAGAIAAQRAADAALAAAEEALTQATAVHGAGSAQEADAVTARDSAAAAKALADWALSAARLDRDVVLARCEFERLQARLRGAERAAREHPADAAAGAVETVRREMTEAQAKVDAAAAAAQAHAATRPGGGGAAGAPPTGATAAGADDAAGSEGAVIDAEAQTLLGYVHSAYLMGIARERSVRDLMRWLMMRFWSANLVLLVSLAAIWLLLELTTEYEQYAALILGLFVIAAIGRVGATMSVVQRLQAAIANNVLAHDPIQELTRLRTGKNGINLALFSGGVFALLVYAFFASGVPALLGFDDGIAPVIATIQEDEQSQADQRVAAQNLARAARDLQEQEARVQEIERELANARGGTDGADETTPEGDAETTPDADRIAQLEAQLVEARAALEQRRAALSVAASAASPSEAESTATEQGVTDESEAGNGSAPAGPNTSAGSVPAGNASGAAGNNVQATDTGADTRRGEAGGNAQAGSDGKPAGEPSATPAAALAEPSRGTRDQCNAKQPCDPFVRLALALGLNQREDFFKLLIWAFLAGFAERLVPDALDAIASRARRRRRGTAEEEETA